MHFERRIHSPELTLVFWLTASHSWVARAKEASCLLHWLPMFTLAVQLYTPAKSFIWLHIEYKTVLTPKLEIISTYLIFRASLILQETRSIHDSMNIPKIDLISYRRMAENGFAPPPTPLGNFADKSCLVDNWKPSLLRNVCTLCSGALVCNSL